MSKMPNLSRFCSIGIALGAILPFTALANRYVDAGVPAIDKTWSATDYLDAYTAIKRGSLPLPMLDEPDGAAVLRSMSSKSNLDFLRNPEIPLGTRLDGGRQIALSATNFLMQYEESKRQKQRGHSESAMLSAFMLRLNALPLELKEQQAKTTEPKEDLGRMKAGLLRSLEGVAGQLTGAPLYSDAALTALLDAMDDVTAVHAIRFTQEERATLNRGLERAQVVIPKAHQPKVEKIRNLLGKPG
jgi:hypothetical protein